MTGRAILWDMDGVLVDSTEMHYQAFVKVLGRYGIQYTRQHFAAEFGRNNRSIVYNHFPNADESLVQEISHAKEMLFRQGIRGTLKLLPGALNWLETFQKWGLKQAIVSSGPQENIEATVDETGIRGFFDALVSAAEMPGKPDPAGFLHAARLLNVAAQDCLVIEDAPAGVEGARRAGMKSLAVLTTRSAQDLQAADLIVYRLTDLTDEKARWLAGV